MNLNEAFAGAAGGVLASFFSWFLGRSDSAKERREAEIRAVAERVITEARVEVRLTTMEVILPRIETSVSEVKESVGSLNDKLDRLSLGGRMPIKKGDE